MPRNEFGYVCAGSDGISFGDPGTTEERWCGVCGTKCLITRGHNGPTSFAESMAGRKHPHDTFQCPHYGSEWHDLSIKLIHEWRDTNSKRLRALIELDLDDLLEANLPKAVHTDSRKTFATDAAGNQVEIANGKGDEK